MVDVFLHEQLSLGREGPPFNGTFMGYTYQVQSLGVHPGLRRLVLSLPLHGADFTIDRRGSAQGVWLGDPQFDSSFQTTGDLRAIRALLSYKVRRALQAVMALGVYRVVFCPEQVRFEMCSPPDVSFLTALYTLVQELSRPMLLRDRLLATALQDPEVRVRTGAAEVLLDDLRAGCSLDTKTISQMAYTLAASSYVRRRLRLDAAWVLADLNPQLSIPQLLKLIKADDPEVTRVAVRFLGQRSASEVSSTVLLALLDHDHEGIASDVVRSLGRLEGIGFEVRLQEILNQETRVEVLMVAVEVMGDIGQAGLSSEVLSRFCIWPWARRLRRIAQKARDKVLSRQQSKLGALALPKTPSTPGYLSIHEHEP